MTQRGRNTYDIDRLASVEDELAFALRSLDDLEAEHASGQVSDATYRKLHATYTVQAAEAARSRREIGKRKPVVAPRRRRTKLIASVILAVLVIGVAVSLHLGSRTRAPGSTITGDSVGAATDASSQSSGQRSLDAAAEKSMVKGDYSGALKNYVAALKVNPRDIEALTYAGWLSFLAGAQKQAVPLLQTAVRIQPSYPDAHAFLGIVLLRSHQQQGLAMAQLRQYLRLVPSGQMSEQVRRVLQVATKSSRTRGHPTR